MKCILSFFLWLFVLDSVSGQEMSKTDSLDFCGQKIAVPSSCSTESPFSLKCEEYSIAWAYLYPQMLPSVPDKTMETLQAKKKDFKKTNIYCYLGKDKVRGYQVSYFNGLGNVYIIFAFGESNHQTVLFQIITHKPVLVNSDIPKYVRPIFHLSE
jgi:hypothetical protein